MTEEGESELQNNRRRTMALAARPAQPFHGWSNPFGYSDFDVGFEANCLAWPGRR